MGISSLVESKNGSIE